VNLAVLCGAVANDLSCFIDVRRLAPASAEGSKIEHDAISPKERMVFPRFGAASTHHVSTVVDGCWGAPQSAQSPQVDHHAVGPAERLGPEHARPDCLTSVAEGNTVASSTKST